MKTLHRTWNYKDANRVYWRINTQFDRPDPTVNEFQSESDSYWRYFLINEDTNTTILTGEVWSQYDFVPDLSSILADIQLQMAHLCLGMAKYAKYTE